MQEVMLVNVKSSLLKLLEGNRDAHISGGALATQLGVSRNAVWKAVESLRTEGYEISAVTNKGYRLEDSGDILSAPGISGFLKNEFTVETRKVVTSTNTVLRELAARGAPEGHVLAAEEQTAGKGRQGRSFHSPAKHGVYFSLLMRPGLRTVDAALITSAAAVAVSRAIEETFGVRAGIKWVNDLFVGEKKVCGILTEAAFDMESGLVESVVLGIGVNLTRSETGWGIEDVATTLTDRAIGRDSERNRLIAASLDNFWGFYKNLSAREFLDEYRARSIVLGQDIYVLSADGEGKRPARAIEIDDECGLVVRYEDGEVATLSSGEVSIRPVGEYKRI